MIDEYVQNKRVIAEHGRVVLREMGMRIKHQSSRILGGNAESLINRKFLNCVHFLIGEL